MSYMIVLVKEDDNWCWMIAIFSDLVKKSRRSKKGSSSSYTF